MKPFSFLLPTVLLASGWPLAGFGQADTVADIVADEKSLAAPIMTRGQCLVELDATVALSTNETAHNLAAVMAAGSIAQTIDRNTIDARLAELETLCPDMPQLAHNRGVLAAKSNRWPEAIAHFERSLQMDGRAADTYRHLQEIYEHEAAMAYAKALDSPIDAPEPTLNWQDSGDLNADAGNAGESGELGESLRSVSTLEYELFDWWNALRDENGLEDHYVDDFPVAAIQKSRQFFAAGEWENIQREIAFTATDAVTILTDSQQNRTLMLMRLVGTRWKIYQETRL